jgi:hypothetical protein
MKKYLSIIAAIVLLIGFFTVGAKAAALYYVPSAQYGAVASSTSAYVLAGTSITNTFSSDGYEQVSYLVGVGSSTTPPVVSWKAEYSNNGTDWYADSTLSASSTANYWLAATTTAGATIISKGTDGVTLFVGRRIDVANLSTQYTRVTFSLTGAAARVDIQRSLKNTVVIHK